MKPQYTIDEAIKVLGLPEWYAFSVPAVLRTREAFALFLAAEKAGIIFYEGEYSDSWGRGLGRPLQETKRLRNTDTYNPEFERPITLGQLAYFCKRASKRLHLNNGAQTNWAPFESMFHFKPKTLRRYLHNVQERNPEGRQADTLIDTFFEQYGQQ